MSSHDDQHHDDQPTTSSTTTTTETDTLLDDHPPPPKQNGIPTKIVDDAPRNPSKPIPDEDDEEEGEIPDDGSDFEIETEARTSSPQEDDDSVALNVGCGIPCRFYNHDRCTRGAACGYLHGPDDKSVRDGHGKNVCLYFLMGECKFGIPKCAYSHRKDFLPEGGWWESDEGIQDEKRRIDDERAAQKQAAKERQLRHKQQQQQQRGLGAGAPRRGGGGGARRYEHDRNQSAGIGAGPSRAVPALPFHLPQPHGNGPATVSVHELAERMQNFGFTERQLVDLANYGVKPWDDGAWTTLNMLYHY